MFDVTIVAQVASKRLCEDIAVRIDAGAFDEPSSLACPKHRVAILGFDTAESPGRTVPIGATFLPSVYEHPSAGSVLDFI